MACVARLVNLTSFARLIAWRRKWRARLFCIAKSYEGKRGCSYQASMRTTTYSYSLIMLGLGLLAGSGCADTDPSLGRRCDLGGSGAKSSETIINSNSADCLSRLCVRTANQASIAISPTIGHCSATCEADAECAASGDDCKTGYACRAPTAVGAFCCQKMCVCKDDLPATYEDSEACNPGNPLATCQNL